MTTLIICFSVTITNGIRVELQIDGWCKVQKYAVAILCLEL